MINFQSFFKLTYGLYVVSSHDGEVYDGHISNTVFQVSAEPPQLAIASHKNNFTTSLIKKSGVFSVSVLQQDVSMEFLSPWGFKSGRDIKKFEHANFITGETGCPVLKDKAIAWFDCKVTKTIDVGSHMMFIGEVIDSEVTNNDAFPLTYSYYRDKIKGLSPENSPTYQSKDKIEALQAKQDTPVNTGMPKYRCLVCGYIYDPVEGDPPGGIAPGTAFEDIPDDWTCPICGISKSDFVLVEY